MVDEFGSVEGIVTLTDVMETIAGNLPENDEEVDARHDIQQNEDGSWIANGYMPLEDLVLYLPMPLEDKREYHTLAGLLMEHSQRVPQEGEQIKIGDYLFEPLEVNSHRILKVKITPPPTGGLRGLALRPGIARPFFYWGTSSSVATITTTNPTITGTEVRFTTSNGEIFAMPETATTTPETGDSVRPRLDACSIGITR